MDVALLVVAGLTCLFAIPSGLHDFLELRGRWKGKAGSEATIATASAEKLSFKRSLDKIAPYCFVGFLLFGLIALGLTNKKANDYKAQLVTSQTELTTTQIQYSNLLADTFAPITPTNVVEGQTFRSQVVPLDGMVYRDCKFLFVTFKYDGKRPFRLDHNYIGGPISFSGPPAFIPQMVLMHVFGILNTNSFDASTMEGIRRFEAPDMP
jgi:hypothetical protein